MSIISLEERKHDLSAVLRDFQETLATEPEWGRDGVLVIFLDRGANGGEFNTKTLCSDMRRMDVVAVLEMVKYDMLDKVRAGV